jgi:flagellar hook-associated protein 2
MAGSITSLGVGSGLELETIVETLVAAESRPIVLLQNRRNDNDLKISAFGLVRSALSTFQGTLDTLADPESFRNVSATSSDSEIVSASASQSAVPGSTSIEVAQLAQFNRIASQAFVDSNEIIGTGQLNFTVGAETFNIDITPEKNTLAQIRDAINNENDNTSVQASIINVDDGSRLVLTARESGSSNQIVFTVTDDDGNNLDDAGLSRLAFATQELDPPLDAIFEVEGFTVTRPSNEISDVVEGLTFTLQDLGNAEINVTENLNVAGSSIDSFVSSYNTLVSTLSLQRGSTLSSENALLAIENGIRNVFTGTFNDSSAQFNFLFQVGLSFDDEGTLSFDQEQFTEAVTTDFADVQSLFTDTENGFITRLDDVVTNFTQTGGVLNSRTQGLSAEQNRIDDDIAVLASRLELTEARIRSQFNSLDVLVAQLNATSSFLTQQLANLSLPDNN